MMNEKIQATITVLTFNSERTLEACLRSVGSFDEILVLDGGSTDRTVEIARSFGARVEKQSEVPGPISNFTDVRIRSFDLAKHDWIFWLDSDEYVDAKLVESIRETVRRNDSRKAYLAERVAIVDGHVIRYAYFVPDMNLRLVNRKTASWVAGKRVHEHLRVADGVFTENLSGSIFTPWGTIESYDQKDRYYISLAFAKRLERRPPFFVIAKSILKNTAQALVILCKAAYFSLRYAGTGAVLPFVYHWRFARYHLVVSRERARQFLLGHRYVPPSA